MNEVETGIDGEVVSAPETAAAEWSDERPHEQPEHQQELPVPEHSAEQQAALLDAMEQQRMLARARMREELLAMSAVREKTERKLEVGLADVWTYDSMKKGKPLTAHLYGNPLYEFTFRNIFQTDFVQERLAYADRFSKGEVTWPQVVRAYTEIVNAMVITWSLRDVERDEFGDPIWEDEELGLVKTKPVPKTLQNVARLDPEDLTAFMNAMSDVTTGERSGQPS